MRLLPRVVVRQPAILKKVARELVKLAARVVLLVVIIDKSNKTSKGKLAKYV